MKKLIFKLRDGLVNFLIGFFSFIDNEYVNLLRSKIFLALRFRLGNCSYLDYGVKIHNASNVKIGNKVGIGHYNRFWGFNEIVIEDYTQTALNVVFVAGNHSTNNFRALSNSNIIVEKGCWIGANVTVVGPVRIGRGAVVGAGAVVVNDLEPWSINVGVPARKVGERTNNVEQIYGPRGLYDRDLIK